MLVQELYKSGAIDADAHVCVTGHSMGGALAVLAAHDIAAELKPHSMQVQSSKFPFNCACMLHFPGTAVAAN